MKTKLYNAEINTDADVNVEERWVIGKISTCCVDRDGDVMMPQGCNSKDFEANPVVFFNHNYRNGNNLPIGKSDWIKREDGQIIAKTTFAERPEGHPEGKEWLPDTLLSLFKQGVIKGFSVGFEPMECRLANQVDQQRFGKECRQVISKWKMLEYSVAPLPANQEALAMAVAKGLVLADVAKDMFNYEYKGTRLMEVEPGHLVVLDKNETAVTVGPRRVMIVSGAKAKQADNICNLANAKAKGRIYVV